MGLVLRLFISSQPTVKDLKIVLKNFSLCSELVLPTKNYPPLESSWYIIIFQQRHSGDIVPNIFIVTSLLSLWVLLVHFMNVYLLLLQKNYFFYYISSNTICFYVFIYREVYCLSKSCSIKSALLMFD